MRQRMLGKTNFQVSAITLGGGGIGMVWGPTTDEECVETVKQAVASGINIIDVAPVYGRGKAEEIVGQAWPELNPKPLIATKVCRPMGPGPNQQGLSRKHIMDSIDASLKRLGTDYVDLYQIHRWDHETPIEETLEALNDLVRAGKVRYLGASSMYAWQFSQALHISQTRGWSRFVSMQNH